MAFWESSLFRVLCCLDSAFTASTRNGWHCTMLQYGHVSALAPPSSHIVMHWSRNARPTVSWHTSFLSSSKSLCWNWSTSVSHSMCPISPVGNRTVRRQTNSRSVNCRVVNSRTSQRAEMTDAYSHSECGIQ